MRTIRNLVVSQARCVIPSVILLCSCTRAQSATTTDSSRSTPNSNRGANNPRQQDRDPRADTVRAVFEQYLSTALINRPVRQGMFDPVMSMSMDCHFDNARDDVVRFLADYTVLSVDVQDETTAVATAAITTVADQMSRGEETPTETMQRISETHARWNLVRNAESKGKWMVCGGAIEGFALGFPGAPGTWHPDGASAKTAVALVDSIRKARGKPLVPPLPQ